MKSSALRAAPPIADFEMLAGFPLVEVFTHAEDDTKSGTEGELHFLDQLLIGLAIVLTTLGVAEDGPLAADRLEHVDGHFAGVGSLHMVGTVLGGKLHLGALKLLAAAAKMRKRRSNDQSDTLGDFCGTGRHGFGKFDTIRFGGIHFPVACNNFLSHNINK